MGTLIAIVVLYLNNATFMFKLKIFNNYHPLIDEGKEKDRNEDVTEKEWMREGSQREVRKKKFF